MLPKNKKIKRNLKGTAAIKRQFNQRFDKKRSMKIKFAVHTKFD